MADVTEMRPAVLLLDKPVGPTSHDLVQRVRRAAGTRRVGHAGTLDPGASGLMILGLGAATRLLTFLVGLDKTYLATIRLGRATTTDDAGGEALGEEAPVTDAVRERLPAALAALTGEVDQVPSSVSAVHVGGRRAHELVREGAAVELPSRRVRIDRLDLLDLRDRDLDVVVGCSSGTYIRAIARDLGAALGVGGHVTALRRTRVGPFLIEDAAAPPDRDDPSTGLRPLEPAAVARALFPAPALTTDQVLALAQGKRVAVPDLPDAPVVAVLAVHGDLVGLAEVRGGVARALFNLPTVPGTRP